MEEKSFPQCFSVFTFESFSEKRQKSVFLKHITSPSIFCGALYLHITSHLPFATPVKHVKGFQVLGPWWIGGTPRICHVRGSAWNGLENDKGTTAPRTERGRAFGAVWPCQGEARWILVEDHFLLVSKWLGAPQVYKPWRSGPFGRGSTPGDENELIMLIKPCIRPVLGWSSKQVSLKSTKFHRLHLLLHPLLLPGSFPIFAGSLNATPFFLGSFNLQHMYFEIFPVKVSTIGRFSGKWPARNLKGDYYWR